MVVIGDKADCIYNFAQQEKLFVNACAVHVAEIVKFLSPAPFNRHPGSVALQVYSLAMLYTGLL